MRYTVAYYNKMPIRTPEIDVTVEPIDHEAVGFAVDVVRQFSPDHPAALDLTLSNESDRERTFSLGEVAPFSRLGSRSNPEGGSLTLIPDGRSSEQATETASRYSGAIPDTPDQSGCWRVSDVMVVGAVARAYALAPDETLCGSYAVLAGRESEACLPSGRYEFKDTVTVGSPGPDASDVSLRFVVTISDG